MATQSGSQVTGVRATSIAFWEKSAINYGMGIDLGSI